jgi:hypothetical protein
VNEDIDALRKALVRAVIKFRLYDNINRDPTPAIDAYLLALVNQDLRQCPSASDLRAQQRRAESAERAEVPLHADWQEAVARLEELERKEA